MRSGRKRDVASAGPVDGSLMDGWRSKRPRSDATQSSPSKPDVTTSAPAATTKIDTLAATAKKPNPKFHPRPIDRSVDHRVPIVEGHVPRGASILIIQDPWLSLILDGHKTMEIRGTICKKPRGEKVFLALSGAGGLIIGAVSFVACHGPLTRAEYAAKAESHCVAGETLPYGGHTYAWQFKAPVRFREPVRYVHKPGVVVWAKM